MLVIKFLGVALVVCSGSFIGFFKSSKLVERYKKLSFLIEGVTLLYEYINQENFELEPAIKNAFYKCSFLKFKCGEIFCDDNDLKNNKSLIEEFFNHLGRSSKKIECDRINCFRLKLIEELNSAKNDVEQKSKTYKTLGVCFGLILGILLI